MDIALESFVYHVHTGQPNIVDDWVVDTIGHFLASCPQIQDIVIEEYKCSRMKQELFPKESRIDALYAICSRHRPRRKVGIRAGSRFYDIV